jgi:hypothetical protein
MLVLVCEIADLCLNYEGFNKAIKSVIHSRLFDRK